MTTATTKTTKIDNCDNNSANKQSLLLNFSIDHILKRAGANNCRHDSIVNQYEWLQCSRYCPPKIQKSFRKDTETRIQQKRRLGNHPRIPFTKMQLFMLEEKFKQDPYLSGTEVKNISTMLEISERRVKIWFQNRRAKQRRDANDISSAVDDRTSPVLSENSHNYYQQQQQHNDQQQQSMQFNGTFNI